MANEKIIFDVGYNIDKSSLGELKKSLSELQSATLTKEAQEGFKKLGLNASEELMKVSREIIQVDAALTKAFNPKLNTININKFNQELKKEDFSLEKIIDHWAKMGPTAQSSLLKLTGSLLTSNKQLEKTTTIIDKMATTLANTVKWNIASAAVNKMTGSVQQAVGFVKSLDNSLNDIAIVTGKSSDEMDKFAKRANDAAKSLGTTTVKYAEASLTFYQQGLSDEEVKARTDLTTKVANVTGLSSEDAAQYVTSVLNGYKVGSEEAEAAMDKLAAVGATTASSLAELSEGMSKVASTANAMGVSEDQLAASLATVISTTRQDASSVGTAFKTIYARISDIKAGSDEAEISLGNYTAKMAEMGFNVLDSTGQMRDLGEVIEEIGNNWANLSREQQISLAQTMAGTRQYNNLIALFDGWDQYQKAINVSMQANGTLQKQQNTYLESTAAHLKQAEASWEGFYSAMIDEKSINTFADLSKTLGNLLANFTTGMGGGLNVITLLGSTAARVFSTQIAQGLTGMIMNFKTAKSQAENYRKELELLSQIKLGVKNKDEFSKPIKDAIEELVKLKEQFNQYGHLVSAEQQEEINNAMQRKEKILEEKLAWEQKTKAARDFLSLFTNEDGTDTFSGNEIESFSQRNNPEYNSEEATSSYETIITDLQTVQEKADAAKAALEGMQQALEDSDADSDTILEHLEEEGVRLKELAPYINKDSEAYKKLEKAYKSLAKVETLDLSKDIKVLSDELLNGLTDPSETIEHTETQLRMFSAAYAEVCDQVRTSAIETGETIGQAFEGAADNIAEEEEITKNALDSLFEQLNLSQKIQNISTMIGAFGQLASSANALKNAWNIWKDEDISTGDKLLQIVLALSTALPMMGSSLFSLAKSFGLVKIGTFEATAATEGYKIVAREGTEQQIAFNAALLANPFTAVALGILACVAALRIALAIQQDQIDKDIKEKEAIIETNNARQTEIDTNLALAKSYDELYDNYQNGLISKEEMKSKTDELCEALGIEKDAVADLTGNYSNLAEEIKAAKAEQAKEGLKSAIEEQTAAADKVIDSAVSTDPLNLQGEIFGKYRAYFQSGLLNEKSDKAAAQILAKNVSGTSIQKNGNVEVTADSNSFEDIQALYEEVNAAIAEMDKTMSSADRESSDVYKNAVKWRDSLVEGIEQYKQASEDIIKYQQESAASNIDFLHIDSFDDYEQKRAQFEKATRAMLELEGKSEEEIEKITSQYIASQGAAAKAYETRYKAKKQIDAKLDTTIFAREGKEFVDQHVDDIEIIAQIDLDEVKSVQDLEYQYERIKNQLQLDDINVKINVAEDAASTLNKGDQLSDDQIKALKDAYGDAFNESDFAAASLIEKMNILSGLGNEVTETAKQYSQNLDNLKAKGKETYDDLANKEKELKAQIESREKAGDKSESLIHLKSELDAVQERMAYFSSREYEIDIRLEMETAILDVFQEKVNNICQSADALKYISEKIGEGYIVAADDVAALAAAYPEVLANAEVMEDGRVKLNQATVQAITDGNIDILNSDTETTKAELENKILLLDAEIAYHEQKIEILESLLNGEISRSDAETKLAANEMNYKETLSNAFAETDAINTNAEIANHAESTQVNLENLDALDSRIAEVSEHYSAMLSGQVVTATTGTQKVTNSTVAVSKHTAVKSAAEVEQELGEEVVKQIREELEAEKTTLDGLNKNRAKSTELLSKLLARDSAAEKALRGAGNGTGGKDSGSSKDPQQIEFLEDVSDRYHDIDIQIKNITQDLNRLQKEQARLSGPDLIANLNKQLNILQAQNAAYAQKIQLAKQEREELKAQLITYGATFNGDQIANYSQILRDELNRANDVIAWYNGLSGAQQEAEKETLENAKKRYNDLKTLIGNYDTLVNSTIPGLEDQITDALTKEIEIKIETFNMKLKLRLDMAEAERDWNAFKKKIASKGKDDNLVLNAQLARDNILTYFDTKGSGKGTVAEGTEHINEILDELAILDNGGHSKKYSAYDAATNTWVDNIAKAKQDLEDTYKSTQQSLSELIDLQNELTATYVQSIQAAKDAYDKQAQTYEFFNKQIDHNIKMVQLLYGDTAYGKMSAFYDRQLEGSKAIVKSRIEEASYFKDMMDAAREAGDETGYVEYREKWMSAIEELNGAIETWAENAKTRYANSVNQMLDELTKKLTGGLSLDFIEQEVKLKQDTADLTLDDINADYAIQKLGKKWQKAIDNSSSVTAQAKLNSLMQDQMKMLREKDKLTQYDVDRAEKMYDIALKEIALQDAQMNKSKMQLKRDANGNYSYVYTADEDNIGKAEDDLAAAKNDLYNFDKKAYQDNINQMLSTYKEYIEAVAAARIEFANDEEALNQRLELINETYGSRINTIAGQNATIRTNLEGSAFDALSGLYNQNFTNFQNMSEEEKNEFLNNLIPNFEGGINTLIQAFSGESGSFESATSSAFNALNKLASEYRGELSNIETLITTIASEVESEKTPIVNDMGEIVDKAKDQTKAVKDIREQVQGLIGDYDTLTKSAKEALDAAYNYLQAERERTINAANTTPSGGNVSGGGNQVPSNTGGAVNGGQTSNTNGDKIVNNKDVVPPPVTTVDNAIWKVINTTTNATLCQGSKSNCESFMRNSNFIQTSVDENAHIIYATNEQKKLTYTYTIANRTSQGEWVVRSSSGATRAYRVDSADKALAKAKEEGFATGGYTGNWQGDGKLAFLHQKELVLNKVDTENILAAVDLTKKIAENLRETALNTITSKITSITSGNSGISSDRVVAQYVTMNVEFKDATTASEITTALENIGNIAAQRAFRVVL